MKCSECGKEIIPGNRCDGLPNGVGFVLDDGTVINVCSDCIINVGRYIQGDDGK